jgi:hypothetical protein
MTRDGCPRWPLLAALLLALIVAAALRLARLPELPLGVHYDEAANGILAAEIARGLRQPVFISSYTGKEVLFFYWAAAWMQVLGQGVLALRLTAAVAGICTVGAGAWSAYELFHERRDAGWIGAFTAVFLTTSFWHLILSRYGFRAITQPLLQSLTVAALWRGLRLERRGWLILAGLLCGATAYTYLAARAFPLPLAAALLAFLAVDRARCRTRLRQIGLFLAAAGLAVAPLAVYFAAHPGTMLTRVGQVAARSWAEAWAGLRACLGMFFIRGDPYIRFNLPGRPLFDPGTATLFVLGILLTLVARGPSVQTAGPPSPWATKAMRVASRVFLLAVVPVMLLPSALATGEITPSNLRVVGMLPFAYVFPALSVTTILPMVDSRLRSGSQRPAGRDRCPTGTVHCAFAIVLLVGLAANTAYLYSDWASSPALYEAADGDLADAAAYVDGTDLEGVTPYVASIHYRHPTVAFLAQRYPQVRWLTGGKTLLFPAAGTGLLILPRSADGDRAWIETQLGADAGLPAPVGPDGRPAFRAYRVLPSAAPAPTHPLEADFGHIVTLLGYDVLETVQAGAEIEVLLYWQVQARPEPADLLPIARLADPWGGLWGETRPFHYPAEQWTPGEVVLDHLSVPVGPGAPPGQYRLEVGFYAASEGTALPLLEPLGAYAGSAVELPLVLNRASTPPRPAELGIDDPLDLSTGAGITLLGVDVDTEATRPGEPVHLTLFWRADRAPDPDLTVRLRLGERVLFEDAPVHGTYPTASWTPGEVIADRYDPRLDREAQAGVYPLVLAVVDREGRAVLGPLTLAEITVEPTQRAFEPPPLAHSVGVPLGGQVELLGYQLEPERPVPGQQATLTLYWQALTEMETSYTVFVHLLGPDGGIAAQHDGTPVDGDYPTTLWVADEVVADPHVLQLPEDLAAGEWALKVGMYVARTGTRLAVAGSPDDALRLPLEPESP